MFATDSHLFIGLHRTGTTYVRKVLEAAFGPNRLPKATHKPLCEVPREFVVGRTIVGAVCNPHVWYVSRWAYYHETSKRSEKLGFAAYLDAFMFDVHGPIGKACERLPKSRHEIGAYSWLHGAYFFAKAATLTPALSPAAMSEYYHDWLSVDEMMRRERLDEDLVRVFGRAVRPQLRKHVRNTMAHYYGDWRQHYRTPEGQRWHARIVGLDLPIFEHYGYPTML